jgi:hypothetical protein
MRTIFMGLLIGVTLAMTATVRLARMATTVRLAYMATTTTATPSLF